MKVLLAVFLVFAKNCVRSEEPIKYQCGGFGCYGCGLNGVNLENGQTFVAECERPELVEHFSISDSHIAELNWQHLCKQFPNLKTLSGYGLSTEGINPNAFKHCTKLEEFHLPKSNLKYIPSEVFVDLPNLLKLRLHSNELLDFDAENLVEHAPKLLSLWLSDNDIECERMKAIRNATESVGAIFSSSVTSFRQRDYPTFIMSDAPGDLEPSLGLSSDQINCLSKAQHELELQKFLASDSAKALTAEEFAKIRGSK